MLHTALSCTVSTVSKTADCHYARGNNLLPTIKIKFQFCVIVNGKTIITLLRTLLSGPDYEDVDDNDRPVLLLK